VSLTQILNRGFFGEPAFLLGFIAFLGLVMKRESKTRIVTGTIKAMLGYILLQIGASAAGSSLSNLSAIIQNSFQIIGIIPHNETITALAQINYGSAIAYIMLVGMATHLLIARFSPVKYIFLSGHHVLFMASLLAGVLAAFPMPSWLMQGLGGVLLALCMSLAPAAAQPYVRRVIGGNQFAIAHFNSAAYALTGWVASFFRTRGEEKEAKRLQKIRPFFQDHIVVIAVFTFVLFLAAGMFASPNAIGEMFGNRHLLVASAIQAVWFAAGVYVILHGVRMMLTEIIPAFHGIAERFIPGSIPAVDAPVLFTYSPYSAMVGFLFSFAGGIAAMALLYLIQYTVIIPGIIPLFFSGGAAGVIAYKVGGRKGLVVASALHGFLITLLPIFLIPLLSGLGFIRATFADSDFAVVGMIVHYVLKWIY
jgi:PTS system ascorbate-specific IIC component